MDNEKNKIDKNARKANRKLVFLFILLFLVCGCICANVFLVTVEKTHFRSNTSLQKYVDSVSLISEKIFASRGTIYDSENKVVAQDILTYDIICYMDSNRRGYGDQVAYVDDLKWTADQLAPILEADSEDIYNFLYEGKDLYQTELGPIGRNLSVEQKEAIENIEGIHGIGFRTSHKRYYPKGANFVPQLIGFAKSNDEGKLTGMMGLEEYLNDELSGIDGEHVYQTDKYGFTLNGMYESYTPAHDGYDIYLTIDPAIQDALIACIEDTLQYKEASRAWGAVAEVDTGKILAWGQYPSYDPNDVKSDDTQVNFGAQLSYEAGSVLKPVIYSAAINMGVYDGEQGYDSSPYCYTDFAARTYGGDAYGCIHNVDNRDWGWIPLDYGLIYSSNVATATLLSQYVGIDNYGEYLKKFHLYQKVNTDGIQEVSGYTNYGLSPADDITATYGQGSSTTMLQLIQAYTAMFGNGELLRPYFIDKIVDPESEQVVYQAQRQVIDRPMSESDAKVLQDILRRVVSDPAGTCRHYASSSTEVIGKTGTSEIALDGEYRDDESIVSVMLAFPYEKPKYMIYFAYVSPQTVYFNYDKKPIPDLIDKIVLLTGLNASAEDYEVSEGMEKYEVPNFLTKKVPELMEMEDKEKYNFVIIGDGEFIIDQYPRAHDVGWSGMKNFILTSGENIIIPDFYGWTRKEIVEYWTISKIPILIDGYGTVVSQIPEPGTIWQNGQDILLTLKTPEEVIAEEKARQQAEEDIENTEEETDQDYEEDYYEEDYVE